jgi:hypothetical protein
MSKRSENQTIPAIFRQAAALFIALSLCSCSKQDDGLPQLTCSVTGVVLVDGEPVKNLSVTCHAVSAKSGKNPSIASVLTDDEGNFTFTSFENGDGLPEGEYALTFFWGTMNLASMHYDGPDKLNGRYNDVATSRFRVTVENGAAVDIGEIELTTK